MKYAIPWVLVAILFGGVYFLYSTGLQKETELARLQQNPELVALRAENERLKQAPDANAELLRLRKEVEELPRLRSEVGQLRAENKKLTADLQKAQGQRGQAQTQQQQQLSQLAAENQTLRAQTQQAQAQAQAKTCMNNLLLIDDAKRLWGSQKERSPNAIPSLGDLAPFLPNHALPVCPSGGTYTINSLSSLPTCSIPGHIVVTNQ